MRKLVGIIDRPQFDIGAFPVGEAIRVVEKASNDFNILDTDALIKRIDPLYITVSYYAKKKDEFIHLTIKVDNVVSGQFKITLLEEVK